MNPKVKQFLKNHVINDNHPLAFMTFQRIRACFQKGNADMSYSEIEAKINRRYEKIFGRKLDWDNPKSYNEKINVSKVYMPSELKTRLADKVAVRDWIAEKIGAQYLIPLLGVYDSFDDIDFDSLPDSFVMKCSHDSGSVMLVKDKKDIDVKYLKRKYDFLLRRNYAWSGFEMHYRDIKPKIVIEQYMGDAINDYKILCFNGKPCYCWVDFDRFTHHTRNFYNLSWERQPFSLLYPNNPKDAECPDGFDEMKGLAEKLCAGFSHVRADFYFIGGRIYFGEMTFSSENGFGKLTPDEWDYKLGDLWPFDTSIRKKVLASHTKP